MAATGAPLRSRSSLAGADPVSGRDPVAGRSSTGRTSPADGGPALVLESDEGGAPEGQDADDQHGPGADLQSHPKRVLADLLMEGHDADHDTHEGIDRRQEGQRGLQGAGLE